MFTRRPARSGESPARVFAGEVVSFAAAAVTALATLLPAGSVSFLHDERVARLLPSVVGGAAATALLPHLSRQGGKGAASIHRKGSAEA